jgi:predicted dinucleotide-utilizing enzyme
MRSMADSLDDVETAAITLINDAEQKGMEVSEAKFKLRDVRQARLQSKTAVHAFDLQKFRTVLDKGMTTAALVKTEGKQAVDEYYFRRYGLGIATIIISILALSLYLFIKRLERRQAKKADIM